MKTLTLRTKVSIAMLLIGASLVFGAIKLGQYSDSLPKIEPAPYRETTVPAPFGPMIMHEGGTDRSGKSQVLDFVTVLVATLGGLTCAAGGYDIIKEHF